MVKNQYNFGRLKETKVARKLRNAGARVQLRKGSKGSEDGLAKWPSGRKWLFQSKATRQGSPNQPSSKDLGRLKQKAKRIDATAIIAEVFGSGKIKFISAKTKRELKP